MQAHHEAALDLAKLEKNNAIGTPKRNDPPDIEKLLKALRPASGPPIPFLDIAPSLYLFTARLYRTALDRGIRDLLFLSREGQILKQMFDFHQTVHRHTGVIRTHYLKVSRRSTFLLSLGVLAAETFDILFRQYRRMSISDFLKSLDLADHAASLCAALGVDMARFDAIKDDLPNDPDFKILLELPLFQDIYETQRVDRSQAFHRYLTSVLGVTALPDTLALVDVGWVGTIQDNLCKWIAKEHRPDIQIDGYYLGLAAPGDLSANNRKHGLLYAYTERDDHTYRVFSEHRSLFEIVLHADHGSARRYVLDDRGAPVVVEDDSPEKRMLIENVQPVSRAIFDYFRRLSTALAHKPHFERELPEATLRRHARMAFHPTTNEIEWVKNLSHSENFGLFGDTRFYDPNEAAATLFSRMRFTWTLLFRRRTFFRPILWPWLTIKTQALPGTSTLYVWFRHLRH
ncbi:MAG: hypothetical protein ACRYHA_00405 [Janthinobacterium lividum]